MITTTTARSLPAGFAGRQTIPSARCRAVVRATDVPLRPSRRRCFD